MNTTNTTQEGTWVVINGITVPEDARKHTAEDIDSRATSMAREGQLENILLSREGDQLVLVYGNGRLESAKKAGWEKIRADIKEGLTETQKLMMTLAENEEREDVSPLYTARLYVMIKEKEGWDQTKLAQELGKDRTLVAKYLSLNQLAPEVQESVKRFTLGLSHLLEIAKLPNAEDQVKLTQECAEKDYSLRELQARVKKLLAGPGDPASKEPAPVPAVHRFAWKGKELDVKPLRFNPAAGSADDYLLGLHEALTQFLAAHPLPAEVIPEPVAQMEVAQAA